MFKLVLMSRVANGQGEGNPSKDTWNKYIYTQANGAPASGFLVLKAVVYIEKTKRKRK